MADKVIIPEAMLPVVTKMADMLTQAKIQLADLELAYLARKAVAIKTVDDAQSMYNHVVTQIASDIGLGGAGQDWRFDPVHKVFLSEGK